MIRIPDNVEKNSIGGEVIRRTVNYRFRLKKNTFLGLVGESGDGKSLSAVDFSTLIDPNNFEKNIEKQIVYNPMDFPRRIKELIHSHARVLILDEMHVTVPAKLWYEFSNIAMCQVAATFRGLKRLCLFIVTPNVKWIDSSFREMLNIYSICSRNSVNELTRVKPYQIYVNLYDIENPRIYIKKLWFYWHHSIHYLKEIRVKNIDDELVKKYENASTKFKGELLDKLMDKIIKKIEKKLAIGKDYDQMAEEFVNAKDVQKFIMMRGKISLPKITKFYGLDYKEAKDFRDILMEKLKEKGIID